MIKESEQGYYFVSQNNKEYDLFQGYCINSETGKWRNDICYIHDRETGKLVDWFYGVEIYNKEELEKAIKYYVMFYENKDKE